MKRFIAAILSILLINEVSFAGLITRTYTYTSGNTITANENNTNENTLYNEINGNLSTANILDGTIQNGDMADTQLVVTKFASIVQSTFTWVTTHGAYRRPVLQYISASTVDVENNTGTSTETCIQFPDERRCVTENTGSTSVNRRLIISEAASTSGTKNSGLRSGYVATNNTWYCVYAVKTTDVSTDFVLIADTVTPTQANYSALNTAYVTNSWLYLGMIRYGDNGNSGNTILKFKQSGNWTQFYNINTSAANGSVNSPGTVLTDSSGVSASTYTYVSGTGAAQVPSHISNSNLIFAAVSEGSTAKSYSVRDSAGTAVFSTTAVNGVSKLIIQVRMPVSVGISIIDDIAQNLNQGSLLVGWSDDVLGVGYNPQL